jgi:Ca-activated chloride channel homolog
MKHPTFWFVATAATSIITLAAAAWSAGWNNLWWTPDQRGQRLMAARDYGEAAEAFADPSRVGVARFRAGDFKAAARTFGGLDTAMSAYDQGNALIMLGKYEDAVARYDRALALRPNWADAEANRRLAALRAARTKQTGGDLGDQREKADEIAYDKDKKNQNGQETQTTGEEMSDEAVRSLWLKRVQTKPADFLRARFAFQSRGGKP